MYLLLLQAVASVAQKAAIPVFLWLLHGAERAVKRHEALRAKKKGTPPTEAVKPQVREVP